MHITVFYVFAFLFNCIDYIPADRGEHTIEHVWSTMVFDPPNPILVANHVQAICAIQFVCLWKKNNTIFA